MEKKNQKKKLAKRLSLKNKPKTEKEIQARMDKASETRDAIVKSRVENAATESRKVEEAKVRKESDKGKEARAMCERSLAAHLKREEQKTTVIDVDTGYDGKKKPKKKLAKRLSLKNKPKTEKEIQARMDKASEKRDAIVKSWVENAATESRKVEEAKVR